MTDITASKKACATCGKLYKVCFTCEDAHARGHVFWRATACSPECYQAHLILHEFYYNQISKADAREILDGILTENMLPYTENSRNLIEQIYATDPVDQIQDEETPAGGEIIIDSSQDITKEVEITEERNNENSFLFVPEIDAGDVDEDESADNQNDM